MGLIGIVEHIDESGLPWARYNGNSYGYLEPDKGPEIVVGDVVIVFDDGSFDRGPRELLEPREPRVNLGVVRAVRADETLLETDHSFRWVKHAVDRVWEEWWTVEFGPDGIQAVIAKSPMRPRDEPPAARTVKSRFRVNKDTITDTFDKISGLKPQIAELRKVIDMLDATRDLQAQGMRPVRGVLLAGESGTGKTMLARALAKEAKAEFFQVRGPEITSKWVNESEEMLRALMDEADNLDRAVVFFDEIDSLGGARNSNAHEMTNKLITQFLALLDGFDDKPGRALIVGATNRPEALDPTLLRSGRFDKRIDFELPDQAARRRFSRQLGRGPSTPT